MPPSFTRKQRRPPRGAAAELFVFCVGSGRSVRLTIRLEPIDLFPSRLQRGVLLADRHVASDQLLLELALLGYECRLTAERQQQFGTRVCLADRLQHGRELQFGRADVGPFQPTGLPMSKEWVQINRGDAAQYETDLPLFQASLEFVKRGGR